jgi:hypothetical protein
MVDCISESPNKNPEFTKQPIVAIAMPKWVMLIVLQSSPKADEVSCRARAERCPFSDPSDKVKTMLKLDWNSTENTPLCSDELVPPFSAPLDHPRTEIKLTYSDNLHCNTWD